MKWFTLSPPPARIFDEASRRDSLHIRIQPQRHEIVIPPPLAKSGSSLSPQQEMEYEIVNRLRDASVSAAHLVIHGGLEAFYGSKIDPEKTANLVTWAIEQKDIEIEAAANRIDELEKRLAEVTTERDVLMRVLKS